MEELLRNETFVQFLTAVATGTGSVAIIWWLFSLNWFSQYVATGELKRIAAIVLCFIFGFGSTIALIFIGDAPPPAGVEEWFNALWLAGVNVYAVCRIVFSGIKAKNPKFGKVK